VLLESGVSEPARLLFNNIGQIWSYAQHHNYEFISLSLR
jgi:hypothetical protein